MFDAAWMIQTTGDIPLHKLAIDSENIQHGIRYGPTPRGTFSKMMQHLDVMNLAYESFTFLDLGSGKGRALFLASERPFRRVIGVEFAKELVVATQKNIRRYQNPNQRCFQFEVVCEDVTHYALPVENLVIFIYNAFDALIVNTVLDRIEYSLQEHPRHIIILYLNAVHDAVLEQRTMFEKIVAKEAFSIYGHFSGEGWKQ
ncbi:MAG: class I SAM-dependent methyltransferase [Magnetococcus sp. YQC-5]